MAMAMMIHVERIERSLVHSDRNSAPKPGVVLEVEPIIDAVATDMLMLPFARALAGR
jgi:hypothetical protein